MSPKKWFVRLDDQTHGPITAEQIQELASGGFITPAWEIRPYGDTNWRPITVVKGLAFGAANQSRFEELDDSEIKPVAMEPADPPPVPPPLPTPSPNIKHPRQPFEFKKVPPSRILLSMAQFAFYAGFTMLFFGLGMETTVGDSYNIGLLSGKQNAFIIAGFSIIAGTITFSSSIALRGFGK